MGRRDGADAARYDGRRRSNKPGGRREDRGMDTPRIECMIDRGNNLATPLRSSSIDGGDIVCRGQRGPRDTPVEEGSRGLKGREEGRKEQKVFAFIMMCEGNGAREREWARKSDDVYYYVGEKGGTAAVANGETKSGLGWARWETLVLSAQISKNKTKFGHLR